MGEMREKLKKLILSRETLKTLQEGEIRIVVASPSKGTGCTSSQCRCV